VSDGARIVIETTAGAVEAIAQLDRSIMPGVVHAAAGPDPDRLGETGEGAGTALVDLCARTSLESRAVRARVREV
jgi:anaerobic selenocysteine-containing dehydrogenase